MEKNKAFRKVPREFSHLCRISKCLCHWIIKSYQVQSSDSPVEIPVSPKQFYWPCVKVIEEVCLIDLRQPSTASAYFPWAALCWWDPPSSILHPQNGGNGRSQCTVIFCLSNSNDSWHCCVPSHQQHEQRTLPKTLWMPWSLGSLRYSPFKAWRAVTPVQTHGSLHWLNSIRRRKRLGWLVSDRHCSN